MKKYIITIFFTLFLVTGQDASAHWFQTGVGDIFSAGNLNMGNFTASPPVYLSREHTSYGNSGVITYGGSLISEGNGSETPALAGGSGTEWTSQVSSNPLALYSYDYFVSKLPWSVLSNQMDGTYSINLCNHGLPDGIYHITPTSGTLTIRCSSGKFGTNGGGESRYIFLVDGIVVVDSEMGSGQNTFLMVVSKNHMRVDRGLGGDATDPHVRGIFISERDITTRTGSPHTTPLFSEGTFIAHRNMNFVREAPSENEPAETFIFQPNYLVTMYKELRENTGSFREVAP